MKIQKVTIRSEAPTPWESVLDVLPSDGCTIIVGDQSKSFWIEAVQFALGYSNEIDTLPVDFRSFNGFTEIAFVSSIQMQPILRRTIHDGLIGYTLNGKEIERVEAKSFVKVFGISHLYPFQYCIQPADIDSVLHSDDRMRWHWLLDCCGLQDYNSSKAQSVKLFREANDQIASVNVSLWKIESHLCKFTDHSAEATVRNLEQLIIDLDHVQCKRQVAELQREMVKLDVDIAISGGSVQKWGKEVMAIAAGIGTRQMALKEAKSTVSKLKRQQKTDEKSAVQLELQRQTLESSVLQLRTELQNSRSTEAHSVYEKKLLELNIERRKNELDDLKRQLMRLHQTNNAHQQREAKLQEQRRTIFLRSEQNQRLEKEFMAVGMRDEYIDRAIAEKNAGIVAEARTVKRLQTEMLRMVKSLQDLKEARDEKGRELRELKADSIEEDVRKQKMVCDALVQQSRVSRRKVDRSKLNANATMSLIAAMMNKLGKCLSDGLFDGVESMEAFMQTECPAHLKRQYHGMVIENFTCDPELCAPISAMFGNFLFYHIVDNSSTASEILKLYDASEYKGKVFFFALNVMADIVPNVDPPPFLTTLTYAAKYEQVFRLICDEMPNTEELDAGDMFDADTAMLVQNGAFVSMDVGQSRKCIYVRDGAFRSMDLDASSKCIQWYHRYKELRAEIDGINRDLLDAQQSLETADNDLKAAMAQLKMEKERSILVAARNSDLIELREQIKATEKKIEAKEAALDNNKKKQQRSKETLEKLTKELTEPLLIESEQKLVDAIDAEILDISMENERVLLDIETFEVERMQLQNHLRANLLSRHDALEDRMSAYSEKSSECARHEQDIEEVSARLNDTTLDRATADTQLTELNAEIVRLNQELDEWKQKKADAQAQQQRYMEEQATLERQKNELADKLAKLIADAANARTDVSKADFTALTDNEVTHELQEAHQHVRSYRANNHFDNDLLATLRLQKICLEERRDELLTHEKSIEKAIVEYDKDMLDVLGHTLQDVQMRFGRLFATFVENGTADMEIKSEKLHENDQGDEHAVGLSISASFGANAVDFKKLALPERRIVSLVFILTFQQQSGVPFFLFDCVDRVIPETYHRAWAEYVDQLAEKHQILAAIGSSTVLQHQSIFSTVLRATSSNDVPCVSRISINEAKKDMQ